MDLKVENLRLKKKDRKYCNLRILLHRKMSQIKMGKTFPQECTKIITTSQDTKYILKENNEALNPSRDLDDKSLSSVFFFDFDFEMSSTARNLRFCLGTR